MMILNEKLLPLSFLTALSHNFKVFFFAHGIPFMGKATSVLPSVRKQGEYGFPEYLSTGGAGVRCLHCLETVSAVLT